MVEIHLIIPSKVKLPLSKDALVCTPVQPLTRLLLFFGRKPLTRLPPK